MSAPVTRAFRDARRFAGAVRRQLFPTPEIAAWRDAGQMARTMPRHTPGRIRMMEYDLQFVDLSSVCPQWHDIFVAGSLEFETGSRSPRILDCGANIGLASLFFKHRYPAARITAYEPDPDLFEVLKANLAANGAGNVEVTNAAVWTTNRGVTFRCEGTDSGMIDGLPGVVPGTPRAVPSLRLRDIITAEPIDLLKLDVEGAEDVVLADCEPVLDRVRAIVMDVHEFDPTARQTSRVLDRLDRCGFVYAADDLVTQPWRRPVAPDNSPFPGKALVWTVTIRAWRAES